MTAATSESRVLIGVDLGTSSCKVAAVGLDGEVLSVAQRPTPWGEGDATATELDAGTVLAAVLAATAEALERLPDARVSAIGFTGMAETGLLTDDAGRPLSRVIGWIDQRGTDQAALLADRFGHTGFASTTGRPATALLPVATYAWLKASGQAGGPGEKWLSLPEWMVLALGGDSCAEPSLASRTGFFDIVSGVWWNEVLDFVGASAALLPELRPATESWGRATATFRGIAGAHLTVAGHDHLAAAVGTGAVGPGEVFNSCGTSEAFIGAGAMPTREQIVAVVEAGGTVSRHVVPELAALFAPNFRTGEALAGVLAALRVDTSDAEAMAALSAAATAGRITAGESLLMATPEQLAERLAGAKPGDIWFTALDEAAAIGRRRLSVLETVTGPTRRVVSSGGWLDDVALAAKRLRFGCPVDEVNGVAAGARGAALLAGVASRDFAGIHDLPPVRAA